MHKSNNKTTNTIDTAWIQKQPGVNYEWINSKPILNPIKLEQP